jgi:hypothetical protein
MNARRARGARDAATQDYRRICAIATSTAARICSTDGGGDQRPDAGDNGGGCSAAAVTVTLGDYLDRGPDSRGVLDRLSRNPFPTQYIALKGNHEELFEGFLRDPSVGRHWQQLGGLRRCSTTPPVR